MTKTQIRPGAFETNSSSAHSLVLAGGGALLEQPFSNGEVSQGCVHVDMAEYGWEIESYSSVYDKLSYLYTSTQYRSDSAHALEMIREAVKEHTGLDVFFGSSEGYIDHQSSNTTDVVWDGGVEGIKQFLFNPSSQVFTDNDNH